MRVYFFLNKTSVAYPSKNPIAIINRKRRSCCAAYYCFFPDQTLACGPTTLNEQLLAGGKEMDCYFHLNWSALSLLYYRVYVLPI